MSIEFTIDGSNPFNAIFLPLANKIAENFKTQGIEVSNAGLIQTENKPRIIFGAHSNPNFWLRNKKETDIFLNCEPIFIQNWRESNLAYLSLLKSSRVLDYSRQSEKHVGKFHLFPMPPFFESSFGGNKITDVLFVGSINENRKTVFQKIETTGIKITIKFKIFGTDLFHEIDKARLFLDTNFHDDGSIFNMFRFCLCANTGTVYTGQAGDTSDYPEIQELLGITITNDVEEIPFLVKKLLLDDDYRKKAAKIQRNIADALNANFDRFFRTFGKEFK